MTRIGLAAIASVLTLAAGCGSPSQLVKLPTYSEAKRKGLSIPETKVLDLNQADLQELPAMAPYALLVGSGPPGLRQGASASSTFRKVKSEDPDLILIDESGSLSTQALSFQFGSGGGSLEVHSVKQIRGILLRALPCKLGISFDSGNGKCTFVSEQVANQHPIREGDTVHSIGGRSTSGGGLGVLLMGMRPGDRVKVAWSSAEHGRQIGEFELEENPLGRLEAIKNTWKLSQLRSMNSYSGGPDSF